MGQTQITVANQTLCLCFDGDSGRGVLVRLNDGLEARFSSPECLLHLLEGMVGRRTWQAHRERIEAEIALIQACA
ncbi:MAG: hypothetical protein HGA45_07870 [Chloroflexales bacterium]|nr:hypothetical protein [Chloroflexales bacterium]